MTDSMKNTILAMKRLTFSFALLGAFLASAAAAHAAASSWAEAHGGRLRVIVPGGQAGADGSLRAGIEIELKPGWKTYWRQPGDAGIPPQFDVADSVNLADFKVDFPVPKRFDEAGSTMIGYKNTVVFPVTVTPKDPSQPTLLDLEVDYGLCEAICVPARAEIRMDLSKADDTDMAASLLVARYDAKVPRQKPADAENGLRVASVERDDRAILVSAELVDPDAPFDLFVEGPADWFLPAAKPTGRDGATARWRVPLEWLPKTAKLPGAELRLTLVNGNQAAEQIWTLK